MKKATLAKRLRIVVNDMIVRDNAMRGDDEEQMKLLRKRATFWECVNAMGNMGMDVESVTATVLRATLDDWTRADTNHLMCEGWTFDT